MKYDFDKIIDRRDTDSIKWDFAVEFGLPADVLPLWVADMDIPTAPAVTEALVQRARHGIFGYSDVKGEYFEAVRAWFSSRHGLEVKSEWLVKTSGVVFALYNAVRAATEKGDAVLIQPPVYHPFYRAIEDNGRRVVLNELIYKNGAYSIDFEDFERKIVTENVKLFILCSPHNPIGRVWTREELKRLGDISSRHSVTVVSDEIHCDFTLSGYTHVPFLNACPGMAERTILCTAPSKTFNVAGLQCSNIFIPGEELREAFKREVSLTGFSGINSMGLSACRAAYESGADWLDELLVYLEGNLAFVRSYLSSELPEIKLVEPQGTYFAWLDFSALGLSDEALNDLIVNKAKLWLDAGNIFGKSGEGFQRVVLACPRKTLAEAMERLKGAVRSL